MSDDVNDDRMDGADELAALGAVREALEAVERRQGEAAAERQRLIDRWNSLVEGLRAGAAVMRFDADAQLQEVSGPVRELLGLEPADMISSFEDIVSDEQRDDLDAANRRVLSAEVGAATGVAEVSSEGGACRLLLIHVPQLDEDGEITGVEVIGHEAGEDEAEAGLSEAQERFEELMRKTSRRLLDTPDDRALRRALAAVGEFFDVDRVVANEYDEAKRNFSTLAAWHRTGVRPLEAEFAGIASADFPWAYSALGAGETVVISDSAELPADARAEKSLYASGDVRTSLLVPMVRDDELAGFVSIQSAAAERSWGAAEIIRARRFVSVLSSSLARAALLEELEAARRDAEDATARAATASREIEEAKAAEKKAEQRFEDLSTSAAASSARVEELESEVEGLKQELDEAREAAADAVSEAKTAADDAVREALAEAEEAAKKARAEAEEAAKEAKDSASGNADRLAEAESELEEARRELDSMRADAERAQRRSEDTAADALALRRDLEEARAELEQARRDVAEARRGAPEDGVDDAGDEEDESLKETLEVPGLGQQLGGGEHYDPDATIELQSLGFDPDATLETDQVAEAAEESKARTGPISWEEETTGGGPDLPRALGLNEILERTQTPGDDAESEGDEGAAEGAELSAEETVEVSLPSFLDEIDDSQERDDEISSRLDKAFSGADTGDEADLGDDVEAARELARQVAGKDADDKDTDEDEGAKVVFEDEMTDAFVSSQMESGAAEVTDADDSDADDDDVWSDDLDETEARESVEEEREELDDFELDEDSAEPAETDAEPAAPARPSIETVDLPGVDTEAGLVEVGGNAELYESLLSKFRHDYLGAGDKIENAIEKGNVEIAHLLLNAIKGVAGTLGATRVHSTADGLETALIGTDTDATHSAFESFDAALGELLTSIAGLEGGTEPQATVADAGDEDDAGEEHVSDPKVLRSYLEGLRQHLQARKQRQCQLVIREITARNWPGEINEEVERLAEAVRDEDFDDADETFDVLIDMLSD